MMSLSSVFKSFGVVDDRKTQNVIHGNAFDDPKKSIIKQGEAKSSILKNVAFPQNPPSVDKLNRLIIEIREAEQKLRELKAKSEEENQRILQLEELIKEYEEKAAEKVIVDAADEEAENKSKDTQLDLESKIKSAKEQIERAEEEAQRIIEEAEAKAKEESDNVLKKTGEKAGKILTSAKERADEIIEDAKKQAEDIKLEAQNSGYLEGFSQGVNEAKEEFVKENSPKIAELEQLLQELDMHYKNLISKNEKEITDLAVLIARKVIKTEIKTEPQIIFNMIEEVVEENKNKDTLRITISEDLISPISQAAEEVIEKIKKIAAHAIVAVNGNIVAGGIKIETEDSVTDLSVETQINNIKQSMEEALTEESAEN